MRALLCCSSRPPACPAASCSLGVHKPGTLHAIDPWSKQGGTLPGKAAALQLLQTSPGSAFRKSAACHQLQQAPIPHTNLMAALLLLQTIAFLIAIAAVCISTVNSGVESKSFEVESQLPEDDMLTYRPDFFHTVFALASAYLCMLYLNWNLNELPGQQPDQRFTVSLLGRISAGLDAVLSGRGARWLHLHPMRSS